MNEKEKAILERIKTADFTKPIHSSKLEREFSLNGSTLRDVIRKLRRRGFPIANHSIVNGKELNGYFLAKTTAEVMPTLDNLKGRVMSMLKTIKEMEEGCFKNDQNLIPFEEEIRKGIN